MEYKITMTWDAKAEVWTAESDDIHGLVLESPSYDTLVNRVCAAAPEMLELNGIGSAPS